MAALGIAALALLFTWIFGGFLLRAGGLLLVFSGATVLALSGNANGILVASIGAVLWLLGHGHYGPASWRLEEPDRRSAVVVSWVSAQSPSRCRAAPLRAGSPGCPVGSVRKWKGEMFDRGRRVSRGDRLRPRRRGRLATTANRPRLRPSSSRPSNRATPPSVRIATRRANRAPRFFLSHCQPRMS